LLFCITLDLGPTNLVCTNLDYHFHLAYILISVLNSTLSAFKLLSLFFYLCLIIFIKKLKIIIYFIMIYFSLKIETKLIVLYI
jgi:hypothetical protein